MGKQKVLWCCVECGHSQPKWAGQCSQCKQWNTFHEEIPTTAKLEGPITHPVRLNEVTQHKVPRIQTHIQEFDRLLGGGIVKGALTLVGGDPGIGKSTLLLQVSQAIAAQGLVVLYVCGEESVAQTAMRAQRLGVNSNNLLLFSETNLELIFSQIQQVKPDVIVIDSIQIVYKPEISSSPGSVSQVREASTDLMHIAKRRDIPIFLIGHVTKSGEIAGPRVLEHIVDSVLYFEGDAKLNYRLLRVVKNRFGSTDEIGVFQMGSQGLSEVQNPSQIFIEERMEGSTGSAIIPTLEGSRPILIEVQALVTDTVYSTPSRRCTGLDSNRLALLLAVLEKRAGYHLHNRDVFVSIAGGMRIFEPAVDLAALLAIASSLTNRVIDPQSIVVGEVGLGGEVRTVSRIENRLKEAIHMGFQKGVIPKRNLEGLDRALLKKIEVIGIECVEEAIDVLLH